jgi:DNA-binding protein H-NS
MVGEDVVRLARLEKMTTPELRDLSARIEAEIRARKRRRKTGLNPKATAASSAPGHAKKSRRRTNGTGRAARTARVLYRNPADPSMTWAGRGRKPNWLAKVGNIERFRVG